MSNRVSEKCERCLELSGMVREYKGKETCINCEAYMREDTQDYQW